MNINTHETLKSINQGLEYSNKHSIYNLMLIVTLTTVLIYNYIS